ncbi:MAG: hypothetical protein LUF81_07670 [Clostridiales bacterium]|nr:hypothetical protein [Clostridiales bacterium]
MAGVNMYRGKYRALIHSQGKTYHLGTYKTLEEAAAVRKKAEECLFGEFLEFYGHWKEKADANPQWGQENPVSISVSRTETGGVSYFDVAKAGLRIIKVG